MANASQPDSELTAVELKARYDGLDPDDFLWSQHPDFTHSDWQEEVADGDHLLGYWAWVKYKIDDEEEG